MSFRRTISALLVLFVGAAAAVTAANAPPPPGTPLPVKSYRQLARMLGEKQPQYLFGGTTGTSGTKGDTFATMPVGGTANGPGVAEGAPGASNGAASDTNVQVEGVDEADIVKNDGEFIYQVNRGRVLVIKAFPDSELAVTAVVQFDSEFWPCELFVDGPWMVVIGSAMRTVPVEAVELPSPATVKALVYDITDKSQCVLVREVEIDGGYLSSRKIDRDVYLVARKYPDFYMLPVMGVQTAKPLARAAQRPGRRRPAGLVPAMRDTAKGHRPKRIRPRDVFYLPDFSEPDYLVVAGFNLDDKEQAADVKAILGAGEAVYASRAHLYVADTKFLPFAGGPLPLPAVTGTGTPGAATPPAAANSAAPRDDAEQTTSIYRFDLHGGNVSFSKLGEVPGTVLNQFAMDEHNGHFRVATTTMDFTTGTTANNVYVLNGDMEIQGRLEGLAPGERIYATRFLGDRGYMVTFRRVDPLFVIDLTNPPAPTVLGQLTIPGYSDYLHPYDENHILGFGKDAVVDPATGIVWYQGMKIACFDVSDVTNPVQNAAVSIGDRGSDSEVLHNHKALLFDKERALLAFPVTVAQIANKTADTPASTYGTVAFQGAYVYNFTLESGFVLRKTITHKGAVQTGPETIFYYGADVRRLLYIDTNLYSVSDGKVQVHDLGTFEEKRTLDLP
ncbi:MAG: beta-propeller domain-containing protein [Planctomycetota bacterium]|nr:beta-propeller domain-containing protein [Planctomycetota bacterium]